MRQNNAQSERLPMRTENRESDKFPMAVDGKLIPTSHTVDLSGSAYGKMTESVQGRDPQIACDTAGAAVYRITCTCSVTSCTGDRAVAGSSCTTGTHPERVEFEEFIRFIRILRDEHGFLFDTYA